MLFDQFKILFQKNKPIAYLALWVTIAPVLSTLLSGYYLLRYEEVVRNFNHTQWFVCFFISAITMAFAITPTTYIALVGGYFLGFDAVIYVGVAYQLASVTGYFFTKYLNVNFIHDLKYIFPKTRDYIDSIGENQTTTTILARLSPALPFAMMNVILSIANINVRTFFIAGFIGMLPRTLLFMWTGSKARYLESALENNQGLFWSLGVTALLLYVMFRILKPKVR